MFKAKFRKNDIIRNDEYLLKVLCVTYDGYRVEVMACLTSPGQEGREEMLWGFNADIYKLYHRDNINYNKIWDALNG